MMRIINRRYRSKKKELLNQFYIKYYMHQAGNDSPEIKKDISIILSKLEKLLTN